MVVAAGLPVRDGSGSAAQSMVTGPGQVNEICAGSRDKGKKANSRLIRRPVPFVGQVAWGLAPG